MNVYYVWFTLVERIEAESEVEAFDAAMDMIANRDGMEISSHEIIEESY